MSVTAHETEVWRDGLQRRGFTDDGHVLRGAISWVHPEHGPSTAHVEVEPLGFPFNPPQCRLLDPGAQLRAPWHLDRPAQEGGPGSMCLWEDEHPIDEAPWRDPTALLERVQDWLRNSALGWPGDTSTDLERYLQHAGGPLVLYDVDELADLTGVAVRTMTTPFGHAVRVTAEVRPRPTPRTPGRRHRKDQQLTWITDLGEIRAPITSWEELLKGLGDQADHVNGYVRSGVVERLLVRYTHGGQSGVLVARPRRLHGRITLAACESADTSTATRSLRAGPGRQEADGMRVAIVGCGAIGSFVADLLYRSGVRRLTLLDHETLRPGNLVRHLAGAEHVGKLKPQAVRDCLGTRGGETSDVVLQYAALSTLPRAEELLQSHDVVVDATASDRVSSLLATAAETVGRRTGHYVVSVCTQRDGGIIRVDRFPLRAHEQHLPALPPTGEHGDLRERGCGSPVAIAPPGSVVRAAELASQVVLDAGSRALDLPATVVDVRSTQLEPQYGRPGLVTAEPAVPEVDVTATDLTGAGSTR